MNDHSDFEARLTSVFGKYADRAPVDVDPVSMTGAVARRRSRLAWPTLNRRIAWLAVGAALALLALGAALAGSYLLRAQSSIGGGGLMLINRADWPGSDATRQVTLHVFSLDEANDDRRPVVDVLPSGRTYWLTSPVWSPDHTHALLTGSNDVPGIVDLASNRISPIQLEPADLYVHAGKSAWAPKGDRIATMVSNDTTNIQGSILISDLDGRQVSRLEPPTGLGGGEPSWSPDGSSLILATDSVDGGTFHLLLVPLDGSPARVLLEPAAWYFSPVWSPDGSTVAFESPTGIQTLNIATGRQATISHGDDHTPAWSPDGRRIAFAGPLPENPNGAIYVVDADGSNLHQLTSGFDATPVWSPDGTMIVFSRQTVGSPDSGAATNGHLYPDVWVIGADGGAPRLLVTNAVADW
jgi:Tol biopolymer transport system component